MKNAHERFGWLEFTRALKDHACMVLRRLAGKTGNTAPVLTLVTQFGGGKTHTLATLYHLAKAGKDASKLQGVPELLNESGVSAAPAARVGGPGDPPVPQPPAHAEPQVPAARGRVLARRQPPHAATAAVLTSRVLPGGRRQCRSGGRLRE